MKYNNVEPLQKPTPPQAKIIEKPIIEPITLESKFEQDVFWKEGSDIEDQVIIPFRSFELNKLMRDHIEGGKIPLEVIGFKFKGNEVEIICNRI